jgi:hypothetical protein
MRSSSSCSEKFTLLHGAACLSPEFCISSNDSVGCFDSDQVSDAVRHGLGEEEVSKIYHLHLITFSAIIGQYSKFKYRTWFTTLNRSVSYDNDTSIHALDTAFESALQFPATFDLIVTDFVPPVLRTVSNQTCNFSLSWISAESTFDGKGVNISKNVSQRCLTSHLEADASHNNTTLRLIVPHHTVVSTTRIDSKTTTKNCRSIKSIEMSFDCKDPRLVTNDKMAPFLSDFVKYILINNSAAFVCMDDFKYGTNDDAIERLLTLLCQILSITCLVATLAVFSILPNLRTVPGRCVMCLCIALIIAQTFLQFGSF